MRQIAASERKKAQGPLPWVRPHIRDRRRRNAFPKPQPRRSLSDETGPYPDSVRFERGFLILDARSAHLERRRRDALHRRPARRAAATSPRPRGASGTPRRRASRRRDDARRRARPRGGSRRARARVCERPLRVFAHAVRRSSPSVSNASAATSALDSRFAPLPQWSRPNHEPTVARRSRADSSDSPVTPIGPCSRWSIRNSSISPRSRLPARPGDVGLRLLDALVWAPREEARDARVGAELEQPRRVLELRVAERQRRARDGERSGRGHRADAIHAVGDRRPLRRARQPRRARRGARGRARRRRGAVDPRRRLRAVRRLAGRDRRAAARARARRLGARQRRPLGGRPRRRRPTTPACRRRSPTAAARSATPSPTSSARCRPRPSWPARGSCTPRRSPTCARSRPSPIRRTRSCSTARPSRGCCSATRTSSSAARPRSADVELVNPGSVGVPLDGDPRAAYALIHPDRTLELRRVAYDTAAAIGALREAFGASGLGRR